MKIIALLAIAACLPSCSLSVKPDGEKTYSVNSIEFLRALEVVAQK